MSADIVGVPPNLKDKYGSGIKDGTGVFHCLYSEQRIYIQLVNDNFCDCVDGSDEPSTG